MKCGTETWPVRKPQERKLDVADMKMVKWACRVPKWFRSGKNNKRNDE